MHAASLFVPTLYGGVGAIAVWLHARFPKLEAKTLPRAIGHVALAVAILRLAALGVHELMTFGARPLTVAVSVGVVTIPALAYVLLTWIWLLARLHDLGGKKPRGGHPATLPGR